MRVASGRDSDATIIFMDDLRSRLANRVPTKQVTVTRRTLRRALGKWAISSTCWKRGKPPLWRFPSTKDYVKRFSMPAGALVGAPVGARFHPTLARCQRLDSHRLRAHCTIKRPRVSTDHLVRQKMLQRHDDSPSRKTRRWPSG